MNQTSADNQRRSWVWKALQVEVISLSWIIVEAVLSAIAALQVGSLAMSAFSVDSAVELISGLVLTSRLWLEFNRGEDQLSSVVERTASGVVGACLFALAAFIAWRSGEALAVHHYVPATTLGIAVAAGSSLITPWLARAKRRLGVKLHSHALMGDAACSMTCAYMAWTLLAGLLLQQALGWWWLDPLAAIGILYFVTREAWESATAAWTGAAHVHSH